MPIEYRISQELEELLRWRWWRHGYPAPIWIEYSQVVENFINKKDLKPIAPEHLFQGGPEIGPQEVGPKAATVRLRPQPLPGGLRFAHLHFEGDIFRLDPATWHDFSTMILDSFRERLDKAKTVTFDQVLDLGEAMTTLTRG